MHQSKTMRYVNIHKNRICEAQNEFKEILVEHIAGKLNISCISTKEHKENETFLTLQDILVVSIAR